MKTKYKIILALFIIIVVVPSIYLIRLYNVTSDYVNGLNDERDKILDSLDSRLTDIENAKKLATSYIEVYQVNNKDEYDIVKADIYENLSEDMRKEFGLLEANLPNKNIDCIVTDVLNPIENDSMTFKIYFNLKDGLTDDKQVAFVTIKDNLITSVTRLDLEDL